MHIRVCIKNKKWPELQLKNAKGEWKLIPGTIFEPARAEFNKRSRDELEKGPEGPEPVGPHGDGILSSQTARP